MDDPGPPFLSGVMCNGKEDELTKCSDAGTADEGCASAGVTCGKSTSENVLYGMSMANIMHVQQM